MASPRTFEKHMYSALSSVEEGEELSVATDEQHIRGEVTEVDSTADNDLSGESSDSVETKQASPNDVLWVTVDGKTVRGEYVGDDADHYNASDEDFEIEVDDEAVEAVLRWENANFMADELPSDVEADEWDDELDDALYAMRMVQEEANVIQNCYRMLDADRMTFKEFEEELCELEMEHGGQLYLDAPF